MVELGKPDVVLDDNNGSRTSRYIQPLHIRRSMFVSYGEINSQVRPGTMNERMTGAEQIEDKLRKIIASHNLTWDVYRAMMLLGGINYSDPRTNVAATVSAQIPAHNLFAYNVTSGYRGRPEAGLFRSIVDSNIADNTLAGGIPWTHPDAAIIECVIRMARFFKDTNKSEVTAIYMGPEMRDILTMNNQIKLVYGGLIPRFGAVAGDLTTAAGSGAMIPAGGTTLGMGALTISNRGEILAIAGIPVKVVETMYKDPVDGVVKRVWPKNKVVFVSQVDSQGAAENVGRTQYCISEGSLEGTPGLWTRTQTETQIPAAPGMYMQLGNSGMPYLKYPYRVMHATVAGVDDVQKRLGVIGDLGAFVF
jgi:hypothetical protein